MADLLSTQTLVEVPFIIMTVGEYQLGSYSEQFRKSSYYSESIKKYPNFIDKISIQKTNGVIGQYNVQLTYQITKGDDPDFIEKVLSTVSDTRRVKFTYGDWASPSFIYKEESAIIINIQSSVNFSGSSITYQLTCVSDSLNLIGNKYNFPKRTMKPSDRIKQILNVPEYKLKDIFYGMSTMTFSELNSLIDSDDAAVVIEAKHQINIIDYLNYLVSCMRPINNDNGDSLINSGVYVLFSEDNTFNKYNGPYFKVKKVSRYLSSKYNNLETYDLDIGFPTSNCVTNFSINNTEQWSILYKFNDPINESSFSERLYPNGSIETVYNPNLSNSSPLYKATEDMKTWWTKMTEFPITANVTIKGLVRPSLLMTYVNLNVYWFGQRSIHSGLYVIVSQLDVIDRTGYKTDLKLLRVSSNDSFQ